MGILCAYRTGGRCRVDVGYIMFLDNEADSSDGRLLGLGLGLVISIIISNSDALGPCVSPVITLEGPRGILLIPDDELNIGIFSDGKLGLRLLIISGGYAIGSRVSPVITIEGLRGILCRSGCTIAMIE